MSIRWKLVFLMLAMLAVTAQPKRKRILAIGEEHGYRHAAVTHALATIERLGRERGQ
jgi:hypothetical protein